MNQIGFQQYEVLIRVKVRCNLVSIPGHYYGLWYCTTRIMRVLARRPSPLGNPTRNSSLCHTALTEPRKILNKTTSFTFSSETIYILSRLVVWRCLLVIEPFLRWVTYTCSLLSLFLVYKPSRATCLSPPYRARSKNAEKYFTSVVGFIAVGWFIIENRPSKVVNWVSSIEP